MKTTKIKVELSWQAIDLIDQLIRLGIYGTSRDEVCRRFIDAALVERLAWVSLPTKRKGGSTHVD